MSEEGEWSKPNNPPRNVLSLEERVRAIHEFDRIPVYQKVAEIMNCSSKQIKNIIDDRDSILLYYASKTENTQSEVLDEEPAYCKQKIEFLNRIVYEWIQRIQARDDVGYISTKLMRTIAMDIKNHLKIGKFYPNSNWVNNFMRQYNMTPNDLANYKNYENFNPAKQYMSLKIADIIEFLQADQDTTETNSYMEREDITSYRYKQEDSSELYNNDEINGSYNNNQEMLEEADSQYSYEKYAATSNNRSPEVQSNYGSHRKRKRKTAATIQTYEEALKHLKPLEEFVLLAENFRAIGIISQLEAVFKQSEESK